MVLGRSSAERNRPAPCSYSIANYAGASRSARAVNSATRLLNGIAPRAGTMHSGLPLGHRFKEHSRPRQRPLPDSIRKITSWGLATLRPVPA